MFKPGDKIKRLTSPIPNNNYNAEKLGMHVGQVYTFDKYGITEKHVIVREIEDESFDTFRFEICKEYKILELLTKVDAIQDTPIRKINSKKREPKLGFDS